MLKILTKRIKSNIAQHTSLFDMSAENVIATTNGNVISINGLEGEYTLSGGIDGIASAGCINDTHLFENGKTTASCFFGDEDISHDVIARKLNVGSAFKREVALEAIVDTKFENGIIVYLGGARNLNSGDNNSESEDMAFKVEYTLGVMFKIGLKQIEALGCSDYDKLFINSVIGAKRENTTLVKFNSIVDRIYAGDSYVIDIQFSYIDQMFMSDAFLARVKHFDAKLNMG